MQLGEVEDVEVGATSITVLRAGYVLVMGPK